MQKNRGQLHLTATATTLHTDLLTRSTLCGNNSEIVRIYPILAPCLCFSSPVFPARVCSSQQASDIALSSLKLGFDTCVAQVRARSSVVCDHLALLLLLPLWTIRIGFPIPLNLAHGRRLTFNI
jgi:hypothetical protein